MSQSTVGNGRRSENLPLVDERAERAVLGALLLYGEPRYVKSLQSRGLRAESFYWTKHGAVFGAMLSLASRGESVDSITVYAELQRGTTSEVSREDLDLLYGEVPTSKHVNDYADLVIDHARWRKRRRVTYEMSKAVEEQDQETWQRLAETFAAPKAPASSPRATFLRLVDGNSGAVIDEERACENCQKLDDQLKGAEKEIRGWRARYADLKRDKEEEARQDGQWLIAQSLFKIWQQMTGHTRSPFTADRFYECRPYLVRKEHGPEKVERAIAGLAFDPYVTRRKNGTRFVHNGWHLLFQNSDKFEEYACKAPRDWQPTFRSVSILHEVQGKEKEEENVGSA